MNMYYNSVPNFRKKSPAGSNVETHVYIHIKHGDVISLYVFLGKGNSITMETISFSS
jgi:hypothetical protein